jgi:hypothetical protein
MNNKIAKRYISFVILLIVSGVIFFRTPVLAESIKCTQCNQESPCVTILEFKEVKFAHNIFCWIDKDGEEHWDSDDPSKFDLFYFYEPTEPDKNGKNNDFAI